MTFVASPGFGQVLPSVIFELRGSVMHHCGFSYYTRDGVLDPLNRRELSLDVGDVVSHRVLCTCRYRHHVAFRLACAWLHPVRVVRPEILARMRAAALVRFCGIDGTTRLRQQMSTRAPTRSEFQLRSGR